MTAKYWIGRRPSNGKQWASMDRAAVRDDLKDDVLRLYSRYVLQWNSKELELSDRLPEQTHELSGAAISGSQDGFTLSSRDSKEACWILEVRFAESFPVWRSGMSFARNVPQKQTDIRSVWLHRTGAGEQAFEEWFERQKLSDEA